MQNKLGFIPKRYIQPDRYSLFFCDWAGVYTHPYTNTIYYLEPQSDFKNRTAARSLSILRQEKDCRRFVYQDIKSIKSGIEKMVYLLFRVPDITAQAQELLNRIRMDYIEKGYQNRGICFPSQEELPICVGLAEQNIMVLYGDSKIAYRLSDKERQWLISHYTLSKRWLKTGGKDYLINDTFEELVS